MTEEFRVISNFPDYLISEFGRIKLKDAKKASDFKYINTLNSNGDLIISLGRRYCTVKGNKIIFSNEQRNEEPIKTYLLYVNEETETKKFTIKDLVADTFLLNKPNPINRRSSEEIVAGFIDGNKFNCHYSNLCWMTRMEYNEKFGLRFEECESTMNKGIDGWTYLDSIPDGYFYMYPTGDKQHSGLPDIFERDEWRIKLKDSTGTLDYSVAKKSSPFNDSIEQLLQ